MRAGRQGPVLVPGGKGALLTSGGNSVGKRAELTSAFDGRDGRQQRGPPAHLTSGTTGSFRGPPVTIPGSPERKAKAIFLSLLS